METKAQKYILAMLSAFPQTQDVDALLLAFEIGCDELPTQTICDLAQRYIRGDVERESHRFAPSVPEFVKACNLANDAQQARLAAPATVLQFPKSKFREQWDAGAIPRADKEHRAKVAAMIGDENAS